MARRRRLPEATRRALRLVDELRDLLVDGDDWREDVNGADFVDAMSEALERAGAGPKKGTDDQEPT